MTELIVHTIITDLLLNNDEMQKPTQDETPEVIVVKATNHPPIAPTKDITKTVAVAEVEEVNTLQENHLEVGAQAKRKAIDIKDEQDLAATDPEKNQCSLATEEDPKATVQDLVLHRARVNARVNRHRRIRSGATFTLKDIVNGEVKRVDTPIHMSVGNGDLETARNRVRTNCSIKKDRSNMHLQL